MLLTLKFLTPLFYLLAFGHILFGVYLHSGTEEIIFNGFCSREELYIILGVGYVLLGIICELMTVGVKDNND